MAVSVVPVPLGERSYDVVVGRQILDHVARVVWDLPGAGRAAIVTQTPVSRYAETVRDHIAGTGIPVEVLTVPDGEAAKDLANLADLYASLARIPLGRADAIVAVGGGVVGDLAGFAAATWNRGVALIHVPTTLLAQVDAAIGGKTAVNLPEGKNLVGAFHQPVGVVCDVDTLATLPRRHVVSGLAEVVKCGLIHDPSILDLLEEHAETAAEDLELLRELVLRSVAVKAAVVASDEREAGERAILNLGHTYGHALEAVGGYVDLLHGEAVSVGLCVALRLGARLGHTPPQIVDRTETLLARLALPTRTRRRDPQAVWAAMTRDKKARGTLRFVVLEALGKPTIIEPEPGAVDAVIGEVETEGDE